MDICCPQHVCEIRRKNFSNYTNVYIHMLAGSCSGLTEHVSIFPLDTIKVKTLLIRLIYNRIMTAQTLIQLY